MHECSTCMQCDRNLCTKTKVEEISELHHLTRAFNQKSKYMMPKTDGRLPSLWPGPSTTSADSQRGSGEMDGL
mgnify:FL=1